MTTMLKQAIEHWAFVAPLLQKPEDDKQYKELAASLDQLLDITGGDEDHPLQSLILHVAHLIEAYDAETYPEEKFEPREMLAYLMNEHKLRQSDLPEIGTQSVISELLSGKRDLNVRQIKALCERFGCSAETFM